MKNMLTKAIITAVCAGAAAGWAKDHIRVRATVNGHDITAGEIRKLIRGEPLSDIGPEENGGDFAANDGPQGEKKSVCFPAGTTDITDYCFAETGVSDVQMPDTVRRIGVKAFSKCGGLKHITLPKRLRTIDREAFYGCGLTEIVVPNSVIKIGNAAFAGCKDLKRVVLPARFANLPPHIFNMCDSLAEVEFRTDEDEDEDQEQDGQPDSGQ